MLLGSRLKLLRKEANMSQSDLAKELKLSCTAISQYETGLRFPDYETLIKISELFNVSADFLLGRVSVKNPPLSDRVLIIDCKNLSDEQIKAFKYLACAFDSSVNKHK